ncbi:MAG: hypothetical protein KDB70_04325 [Mycobacterium sp.]|nr:hypothetical protein [Mycobacterium sp.]
MIGSRHTDEQLRRLVERCEPAFRGAEAPTGYPNGLALCVIDSVQSPGVRYASVGRVLDRYRAYRRAQGANPSADGVSHLLATFAELGGPEAWAARIGNGHRTSTRSGVLKAEAIRAAAAVLAAEGLKTTAALRTASADLPRMARAETRWRTVPGQRSGITWRYLLMLAGIPGVKPDRMICRFVADALGIPRGNLPPAFAQAILTEAAEAMGMSPTALDHAVWQYQRAQR